MPVIAFQVALILSFSIALAGPASALDKTGTVQLRPLPKNVERLTNGECKGIGGKVMISEKCSSKSSCQRVDQDGVVHTWCIDGKVN
jgi:hypothetical protein